MEGKEFLGPLVAAPNAHPPHPSFIRSLSVPRLRETQMNQARKSKIEALRKEAKEDFMRIHQAALFMYGSAHYDDDADLSGVTLDDLRKFVASLDKDGLEELWQLAEEFEVRDGAVWLDDIQLTPAYN